jgi:hypothetical protein
MPALSDMLVGRLLDALRGAARLWSRRQPPDEAMIGSIMELLVLERHRAYVQQVPVYRQLAEEQGLAGGADLRSIIGGMMFSAGIFKSYEPGWLEARDFGAMTDWIAEVSSCRPLRPGVGIENLDGWRAALVRQGVRLSSSSGTSGRPSFVPRDAATWDALCGNGRYYTVDDGSGATQFDLLALMPRGRALGLQAAAAGLARQATHSHFLQGALDDAWPGTMDFLAVAANCARPVLVFGTPYHAAALCEAVLADGSPLVLASGSRVLTGGGWKGERPLSREALQELVERALGLRCDAVVDAYSATELNCVLTSCCEGCYHVPPLIAPLVLDEALEWIEEAEVTGILGFLDPFAGSYPGFLVTGDLGHLTREQCPCGLTGWSVRGEIVRAPGHEPRGCAGTLTAQLS